MKEEKHLVELIEHFRGGKLVKRILNGIEQEISPFERDIVCFNVLPVDKKNYLANNRQL